MALQAYAIKHFMVVIDSDQKKASGVVIIGHFHQQILDKCEHDRP